MPYSRIIEDKKHIWLHTNPPPEPSGVLEMDKLDAAGALKAVATSAAPSNPRNTWETFNARIFAS
jgi:hypothetical protein